MRIILVLSMLLIPIIGAEAQNEKPNREAFVLNLAVDSTRYYQQQINESSYFAKEKVLQIYPTERIFLETELKGDSIYSMKVVKNNLNPEKTIVVNFEQESNGVDNERMVLTVKNPFDKVLKYEALMFIIGREDLIPTSIIPVRPRLMTIEMWSYPIISLVLVKWRISNE